jgi:hypothetical protein
MADSKAQQWCFLAPFWLAPMVQNPNLVFFVCNESRFHHPNSDHHDPSFIGPLQLAYGLQAWQIVEPQALTDATQKVRQP